MKQVGFFIYEPPDEGLPYLAVAVKDSSVEILDTAPTLSAATDAMNSTLYSMFGKRMLKEEAKPLSNDRLAEIERRCDLCTPGPWRSYVEGRDEMSGTSFIMTDGEDIYLTGASTHDQDFMANARQDVPLLIREIRRLRALRTDLQH